MSKHANTQRIKGFTLLEMTAVLAVIGLLLGGILLGRDLIQAAELRQMLTEVGQYKTAVISFEDEYGYLPGDMPNAQSFWPDCLDETVSNTCNGDGNGAIDDGLNELFYAWHHLAYAGYIEGEFDADYSTAATRYLPGVMVPIAPRDEGGYSLSSNTTNQNAPRNLFYAKFLAPSGVGTLAGGIATVFETETLDTKIDDGVANTGLFIGENTVDDDGNFQECTTTGSGAREYTGFDNQIRTCQMRFLF